MTAGDRFAQDFREARADQPLGTRNEIITDLEKNAMPPDVNGLGLPKGIQDEGDRQELLSLARAFKAAGDEALAYEGELKPPPPTP